MSGLVVFTGGIDLASSIYHGERSWRDLTAAGLITGAAAGAFGWFLPLFPHPDFRFKSFAHTHCATNEYVQLLPWIHEFEQPVLFGAEISGRMPVCKSASIPDR